MCYASGKKTRPFHIHGRHTLTLPYNFHCADSLFYLLIQNMMDVEERQNKKVTNAEQRPVCI